MIRWTIKRKLLALWANDVAQSGFHAVRVDQIMRKPFDFNTVAAVIAKATMGRTA